MNGRMGAAPGIGQLSAFPPTIGNPPMGILAAPPQQPRYATQPQQQRPQVVGVPPPQGQRQPASFPMNIVQAQNAANQVRRVQSQPQLNQIIPPPRPGQQQGPPQTMQHVQQQQQQQQQQQAQQQAQQQQMMRMAQQLGTSTDLMMRNARPQVMSSLAQPLPLQQHQQQAAYQQRASPLMYQGPQFTTPNPFFPPNDPTDIHHRQQSFMPPQTQSFDMPIDYSARQPPTANFGMPPPPNVPPRPASLGHQPNISQPMTSLQQHQHPSPSDRPLSQPQRPLSQPQRPTSQPSHPQQQQPQPPSQPNPQQPQQQHQRQSMPQQALTATGRIPQPQQPSTQQTQPSLPPIAPRPPNMAAPQASGPSPGAARAPNAPATTQPAAPPPLPASSAGSGMALTRLLQFSGVMAAENKSKLSLSFWTDVVKEYFTPLALMKLTLWKDNARNEAKPFDIGVPILPRFFLVTAQSGVKSMTINLDGARERLFGQGHFIVECVGAIWTYRYTNGYTVTLKGPLTVHVIVVSTTPPNSNPNPATPAPPQQYTYKFKEFQFDANFHDMCITVNAIMGLRPERDDFGGATEGRPGLERNPDNDADWEEERRIIDPPGTIPGTPVNAFGVPQATMRCLELAESVGMMTELIVFAGASKLGPKDALSQYAGQLKGKGVQVQPFIHPDFVPSQMMNLPIPYNGPIPTFLPPPTNTLSNASSGSGGSGASGSGSGSGGGMGGTGGTGGGGGGPGAPFQQLPGTLYSSASPSITHPNAPGHGTASTSSPANTASLAGSNVGSPEKHPKSIPGPGPGQQPGPGQGQGQGGQQQQQGQGQGQGQTPGGATSSPAINGGGVPGSGGGSAGTPTTVGASTPTLKRKQAGGEAGSPTVDQPKRAPRKRGRTGTVGNG